MWAVGRGTGCHLCCVFLLSMLFPGRDGITWTTTHSQGTWTPNTEVCSNYSMFVECGQSCCEYSQLRKSSCALYLSLSLSLSLCVYVCMYVCMYTCMYICESRIEKRCHSLCSNVHVCACMRTCVRVCVIVLLCVRVRVGVSTCRSYVLTSSPYTAHATCLHDNVWRAHLLAHSHIAQVDHPWALLMSWGLWEAILSVAEANRLQPCRLIREAPPPPTMPPQMGSLPFDQPQKVLHEKTFQKNWAVNASGRSTALQVSLFCLSETWSLRRLSQHLRLCCPLVRGCDC